MSIRIIGFEPNRLLKMRLRLFRSFERLQNNGERVVEQWLARFEAHRFLIMRYGAGRTAFRRVKFSQRLM